MMDPDRQFRFELDAPSAVLRAFGDIDADTSGDFADGVAQLSAACGDEPAVIDFSGVTFMDSSGLSVLINASADGVPVVVREPTEMIRRIISMTGLDAVLQVEP